MDFQPIPIETARQHRLRLRFCWRWLVIPFLGICLWGWFDVRQRGYAHPEDPLQHKSDFTVYTEAGAAFFDGRPPYEVTNPRGWTYLYPPLFAMLMAPLYVLPMQDQATVWFVVSLLLCWGCIYESGRILAYLREKDDYVAQHYTAWYPWLGIAAVMAAALPVLNCLQRGQVGILKFYLLALGLRLVVSSRTLWARLLGGVVLALPIVLKVVPLLPVSILILVQLAAWIKSLFARTASNASVSRQEAGRSLGLTAFGLILGLLLFFFIIPSMLVGWNANWQNLKTWSGFVLTKADDGGEDPRSGNSRTIRNQSLQNAAYRLGNFVCHAVANGPDDQLVDFFDRAEFVDRPDMIMDSPLAEKILLGIRFAILAALVMICIRLGLSGDVLSFTTAFGLACVTMLVVSPVSRGHYFIIVAPAILYLPLWLGRENRIRAAKIMTVIPIVLVDLYYIFLPYAGRLGLLGLGMTLWLLIAFVLVLRGNRKAALPALPNSIQFDSSRPVLTQAA